MEHQRFYESIIKQDRLSPDRPYSGFFELYDQKVSLYALPGYRPLELRIVRVQSNKANTVLLFEMATPPIDFEKDGFVFQAMETEGRGGKIIAFQDSPPPVGTIFAQRRSFATIGGLQWLSAGVVLTGDPALVAGNVISLSGNTGNVFVTVISAAGILVAPIFRLRRQYDTPVAGEIIGAGDGVQSEFTLNAANFPICPGSVVINYVGAVDVIRDNGEGKLLNLPPDVRLAGKTDRIDYATGKVELSFLSDYIPPLGNITMDYEYAADGIIEQSDYVVDWRLER